MELALPDGRSFSLHVEGYEFPDEELGPTEDNPADDFDPGRFLIVTASFSTPDGSWQATAPEMKTTELGRLADWLESVWKGKPSGIGVYFTERDLEFTFDKERNLLVVHAIQDFLPLWAKDSVVSIDFPLDQLDLDAAISSIRSQLVKFPSAPIPGETK